MKNSIEVSFDDMQGLVRYGHGALKETCFMLLNIVNAGAAKEWIKTAPVSSAARSKKRPDTALQIAFTVEGLKTLGLADSIIEAFSDEFIVGMSGDESRSRRLGDVSLNAPDYWDWGGQVQTVPHVLLLLYTKENAMANWRKTIEGGTFFKAFQLLSELPTNDIRHNNKPIEPFGFRDGVSQPSVDWDYKQSTDMHDRDLYSNLLAPGEVVLGYPNEYGMYTTRPLIDPKVDLSANELPDSLESPELKDFGRNGTYLVLRQLKQDVPGFWQFINQQTDGDKESREQLASAMVGRQRDGTPLVPLDNEKTPGESPQNNFNYKQDPKGIKCPFGSHIRRSNPRTGDLPAGGTGLISRLIRTLGFGNAEVDEDLIAATRFHRILRRGRAYGSILEPDDAVKPDAVDEDRGLQFICLVANISRQFEFVQNAWSMSSKFAGLQNERDPLLGHREPLINGTSTDHFNQPVVEGPMKKNCQLPQFISVRGGAYFFMPGIRALKYICLNQTNGGEN